MSEPIITFNNRTLTVEGDGWYLEVKVLAAGTQIIVTSNGTSDGCSDMIIRPGRTGLVFISSRASERKFDSEKETPDEPISTKRGSTAKHSSTPAKPTT